MNEFSRGLGFEAAYLVSAVPHKVAIYWNILVQLAYSIANTKVIDQKSYMLLHKILKKFASRWMHMKVNDKLKCEDDAQQYHFKPRQFQIESVIDVEIRALASSSASEAFSEWKEFSNEEKPTDKMESLEEYDILDEEWKHLEDSILSNQLFGSGDLVQAPGTFQVSDADRLLAFSVSYKLGIEMIKGLRNLVGELCFMSELDAQIPTTFDRQWWDEITKEEEEEVEVEVEVEEEEEH